MQWDTHAMMELRGTVRLEMRECATPQEFALLADRQEISEMAAFLCTHAQVWERRDRADMIALIREAHDLGVTFFDCAQVQGRSNVSKSWARPYGHSATRSG